jgi:hypothetical protein
MQSPISKERKNWSVQWQPRTDMGSSSPSVDLDDPDAPLLRPRSYFYIMAVKASLRQRFLGLLRCRADLGHPVKKKRVTYRLVIFLPLLALLAFALVM